MEILKEVVIKYWYLIAGIITLIGIFKFAASASTKGLKGAISQMIAFVFIVIVLVTAAGPFLNWAFKTIVAHVGDNLIVQSGLELTTQTIDLVRNAEVSGEPLSLDISQEAFDDAVNGTKAKLDDAVETAGTVAESVTGAVKVLTGPAGSGEPEAYYNPNTSAVLQQSLLQAGAAKPTPTMVPMEPLAGLTPMEPLAGPIQIIEPLAGPMPTATSTGGGGPDKTYTVKSGDYLAKIAKAHGVTVQQLCSINSIKNCNVIYKNMVLVIP